jgi:HEAT repeat protein
MTDRSELAALVADPVPFLEHADPDLRRLAVAAAPPGPETTPIVAGLLATDPEPAVRRECAETLGATRSGTFDQLLAALGDPDPTVREAVVTAIGELEPVAAVTPLTSIATDPDEDRLVREAAVAALGAIGDDAALPTLLQLVIAAPPQIRRRCVVALSVFDGPRVEEAIRHAADDRNPMVREAAEMIVGRTTE